MKELQFYMDISPKWWVNSSKDESVIKKYICDQFEYDYYPRVISVGRQRIDLDDEKNFKSAKTRGMSNSMWGGQI